MTDSQMNCCRFALLRHAVLDTASPCKEIAGQARNDSLIQE